MQFRLTRFPRNKKRYAHQPVLPKLQIIQFGVFCEITACDSVEGQLKLSEIDIIAHVYLFKSIVLQKKSSETNVIFYVDLLQFIEG